MGNYPEYIMDKVFSVNELNLFLHRSYGIIVADNILRDWTIVDVRKKLESSETLKKVPI